MALGGREISGLRLASKSTCWHQIREGRSVNTLSKPLSLLPLLTDAGKPS